MKYTNKLLIVAGLLYATTTLTSLAQVITFDENGHGSFGATALPFAVGPDPTGGVFPGNVLIYSLPFVVTPGDIGLIENTNTTSLNLSDVVRFVTPSGANNSEMIFYSDFEATDPTRDLADSGLPQSPNALLITETGPEGNNGAVWNPAPGQPGSASTGVTIQYNIISDVPEPGTLTLAACGGGLLLAALRRRQNKI
jgi:hypothetical protein